MIAYIAFYKYTHPDDRTYASTEGLAERSTIASNKALCDELITQATAHYRLLGSREMWFPGAFELERVS